MNAFLTRCPLRSGLALGVIHALLLWLAFPPISFGVIGILAPLPILALMMFAERPWRTGLGVSIGTLPFWAYHHWWVFEVSAAGAPPLMLVQALWPGLLVGLGVGLVRRKPTLMKCATVAILWTGMEFFRGRLFFDGYPWFLTAHPTAGLPLAQWASVLGVYGVSLLIALLGALLLHAAAREGGGFRRWIAPGVCVLVLAGGALLPTPGASGTITVGVVQTNLPQNNKMARSLEERIDDFRQWASLTQQASLAQVRPDLIIWPETMFPGATLSPPAIDAFASLERRRGLPQTIGTLFVGPLVDLQDQVGLPLLIGAIGYENLRIDIDGEGFFDAEHDAMFNSAFVIEGGRIRDTRYDKMFLTPFGETMPYISKFPRIEQAMLDFAASGMSFDLTAGNTPVRFGIGASDSLVRVATPICFEATIPHICRELVYAGSSREADVLINMTNDGWFGSFDAGRANHLLIARWRAIELGTPVVRAANTGISCVVDASGRILNSLGPRQPASVLVAEVPLPERKGTIYASIGDLIGWLSVVASVLMLGASFVRRRATRAAETPSSLDPTPSGPVTEDPKPSPNA